MKARYIFDAANKVALAPSVNETSSSRLKTEPSLLLHSTYTESERHLTVIYIVTLSVPRFASHFSFSYTKKHKHISDWNGHLK